MFEYLKRLQYPVKITNPNPALAKFIISQYGGPDGELAASLRYLSQRYSMPYPELKALLTDIGMSLPPLYRIKTVKQSRVQLFYSITLQMSCLVSGLSGLKVTARSR